MPPKKKTSKKKIKNKNKQTKQVLDDETKLHLTTKQVFNTLHKNIGTLNKDKLNEALTQLDKMIINMTIKLKGTFYTIPSIEVFKDIRNNLHNKNIKIVLSVCSGLAVFEYIFSFIDKLLCIEDNAEPLIIIASDAKIGNTNPFNNQLDSWMPVDFITAKDAILKYSKIYNPLHICVLGMKLPLQMHDCGETDIAVTANSCDINYILLFGEGPKLNHGTHKEWDDINKYFKPIWNSCEINKRTDEIPYCDERFTLIKSNKIEGETIEWNKIDDKDYFDSMKQVLNPDNMNPEMKLLFDEFIKKNPELKSTLDQIHNNPEMHDDLARLMCNLSPV